jgi:hypothetical protein
VIDLAESRRFESATELTPLTYTHPFMHRPLVEYMAAIPVFVASPPGRPRGLMKQSIGDMLPPRIAQRFSKGYADPLKARMLKTWIEEDRGAIEKSFLIEAGHVDRDRLLRTVAAIRAGSCRNLKNVELIFRLQRWLDSRQRTAAVGTQAATA